MEELHKDLLTIFQMRLTDENSRKEQAQKKEEKLSEIHSMITSLEQSLDNLNNYNEKDIRSILQSYYQENELVMLFDKLEIARLAISLKAKDIEIDYNEEELNILMGFLDSLRAIYNKEKRKFDKEFPGGIGVIEMTIKNLDGIHKKLKAGGEGTDIFHKADIDYLMQIAVEEEATVEIQIAILNLINQMNLQMCKKNSLNFK